LPPRPSNPQKLEFRASRSDASAGVSGTLEGVIRPGEIVVEKASRHFRVYPRESRRLKDVFVARRRSRPADVVALRDVSFRVEPGSAVGLVGRNGSGKTTLLRLISGIIKPTSGSVDVGGRVGSLLELGAGFHPDLTGRENVFLNGSIHGLKRAYVREQLDEIVAFAGLEEFIDLPVRTYSSGMYMRLGFAIAAHINADVLLLDEVFAVGDEQFQRRCFGKIFEFKQRGGTIVFVSHDASAVERLCDRAVLLRSGAVEFDGATHDAIVRYRQLLAGDIDPAERGAGLKEWGSGDARIEHVELLGPEGEKRTQFLAGEPLALRLRIASERALAPPRLSFELRDASGLLVAGSGRSAAELGWDQQTRKLVARFDVDQLPLADGRFHLRLGLTDETGDRLYHWLDDALTFVVYPAGEETGVVRLEGRWAGEEIGAETEKVST
jgi:lipopolysaccharide transport system ATP-binding protein